MQLARDLLVLGVPRAHAAAFAEAADNTREAYVENAREKAYIGKDLCLQSVLRYLNDGFYYRFYSYCIFYMLNINDFFYISVNKLTDVTTAPGPEGTIDVVKVTFHSDEVFSGEQDITDLLVDKSMLKTLLEELKTARKKMEEINTEDK